MKKTLGQLLTLLIVSCTVAQLHPSNTSKEIASKIEFGMDSEEVNQLLGPPMNIIDAKDGKRFYVYPLDQVRNNHFYCNHLVIKFINLKSQRKNDFVVFESEILNLGDISSKRCEQYTRDFNTQQIQNNKSMRSIAESINQYIQSTTPIQKESNKECYGNSSCPMGQKCAIKEHEMRGICIDIYIYQP